MRQEIWGPVPCTLVSGGVWHCEGEGKRGVALRGEREGERHTEILDGDVARGFHTRLLRQQTQAVLDDRLGRRVHNRNAVMIPRPRRARNDLLRLVDRRAMPDLDIRRQVTYRLLARCTSSVLYPIPLSQSLPKLPKSAVLGQRGERRHTRRRNPQRNRRRHLDIIPSSTDRPQRLILSLSPFLLKSLSVSLLS